MHSMGEAYLDRSLVALGWSFQFDRARRRLGACKWRRKGAAVKIISLSRHFAAVGGWELMEDVVRHEIAHAIQFERTGRSDHGAGWRKIARQVGADPSRLYDGENIPYARSRYVGICRECNLEQPFYRRLKRRHACPVCCGKHNGGRYDERFRLRLIERATGREVRLTADEL